MSPKKGPALRLIKGGRHDHSIGSLKVMVAPLSAPPFSVEAEVKEEDTWLVMSATLELSSNREHVIRVMTGAMDADPLVPGQVVIREGSPVRLMVVMHDFDREPTCRREWVIAGLKGIFRAVEARQLRSLSLPLLGTQHGPLTPDDFLGLLEGALEAYSPPCLRRLWLVVGEENETEIRRLLLKSCR